jgi:hypothetical protein
MKVEHPLDDPRGMVSRVTSASDRPVSKAPAASRNDAVRLSEDVGLVDEAVRAAALTGDVRPEAVARARALLERGEIGVDVDRLADRLIEALTHSHDDNPDNA